jgi:hypothetical protein
MSAWLGAPLIDKGTFTVDEVEHTALRTWVLRTIGSKTNPTSASVAYRSDWQRCSGGLK